VRQGARMSSGISSGAGRGGCGHVGLFNSPAQEGRKQAAGVGQAIERRRGPGRAVAGRQGQCRQPHSTCNSQQEGGLPEIS
jgi:hypothetical protein